MYRTKVSFFCGKKKNAAIVYNKKQYYLEFLEILFNLILDVQIIFHDSKSRVIITPTAPVLKTVGLFVLTSCCSLVSISKLIFCYCTAKEKLRGGPLLLRSQEY